MIKKFRDWMHWRGVTVKDLMYSAFAIGCLTGMCWLLLYLILSGTPA